MNCIRFLVYLALLCASCSARGDEFSAKVIVVIDGDTVLVVRAGGKHPVKVRLAEIDAPEKDQPFGETSKRTLSGMVLGKQVKVVTQAVDDYGRLVAHLDLDGLDVNAEQLRRGMAWENSHFHRNHALVVLQEKARQAPHGLWALANPTPPWEWRKLHPNTLLPPTPKAAPSMGILPASSCGKKKHCSEMTSCEEARHYLKQCGIKTLDGDGDGVPCESLCATAAKKSLN